MSDEWKAITAMLAGAAIGGLAGYLLFTERGRAFRRSMEPALDDLAQELSSFRTTLRKATGAATEGWRLLNGTLAEESRSSPRYATPHQSSPF